MRLKAKIYFSVFLVPYIVDISVVCNGKYFAKLLSLNKLLTDMFLSLTLAHVMGLK